MAKGNRPSGRPGVTSITDDDGSTLELDMPLNYGDNDSALDNVMRQRVEEYEEKRRKAKIEFSQAYDQNALRVMTERRGGKHSVRSPWRMLDAYLFTHNHPREAGVLGGTFSVGDPINGGDLYNFSTRLQNTLRASAKEGTYSISKLPNFNGRDALAYWRRIEADSRARLSAERDTIRSDYKAKVITYEQATKSMDRAFNRHLIRLHDGFAAGANQYGYFYTLERRK